ncbi:MAG: hypothetical protein IKP77_01125 [Acholeplasmatales bacterium]|nr:hypothetical protein [Acholeplasmatales bacterium]
MKNLTLFYIKKRLPLFLIVLGLSVIVSLVYIGTVSFYIESKRYDNGVFIKEGLALVNTGVPLLSVIMIILATIVPVYEFSFKMRKTGCDLFYSLPIKRKKLFIFKYIFGICEMLAIFLVIFIIVSTYAIATLSGKEFLDNIFHPGYYYLYLIVIIFMGILLYSWVSFFYTRGKTILDGVVGVILSSIIVMAITFGLFVYIYDMIDYKSPVKEYLMGYHYPPQAVLYEMGYFIEQLIKGNEIEYSIVPTIIGMGASALSVPLFIIFSGHDKAEESQDISNSIFLYKTMLPILIVSLFLFCEVSNFSFIAIVIGGYIGYAIYNRHFLLKKNDLIVFSISLILGFGLMFLKLAF